MGRGSLTCSRTTSESASEDEESSLPLLSKSLSLSSDEEDEDDTLSAVEEEHLEHFDDEEPDSSGAGAHGDDDDNPEADASQPERNVRIKLTHPSSPHQAPAPSLVPVSVPAIPPAVDVPMDVPVDASIVHGPPKVRVIVKDVAYSTYLALLYYLYTDSVVFAPLSSTFPGLAISPRSCQPVPLGPSASEGPPSSPIQRPALSQTKGELDNRKQWIQSWKRGNPGRVGPCSAKAMYRLADKLDLQHLKARAFEHIAKSLTVTNIPHEMFSSFSAVFEEVRKVQVDFFLAHWSEIRGSDAMRNIWQQIRLGKHPGFEEVWPMIAVNLEFKPGPGKDDEVAAGKDLVGHGRAAV